MNKRLITMVSSAALCFASVASAASVTEEAAPQKSVKQEQTSQASSRWQYYNQYTRWSLGVNVGMPIFVGDFRTKDYEKFHMGGMADLQIGYQITPLFGLRLNAGYAQGNTGAKSYERNYYLDVYGNTDFRDVPASSSKQFQDLYSSVRLANFGLYWDINVNDLFRYPRGERRWTVLVSPGITLQKYFSKVKNKSNDNQFSRQQYMPWTVSVGADAALRYKASKAIDIQARAGIDYIHQNTFESIKNYRPHNKQNWMAHVSLGIIWKIGSKKSNGRDNLLYAAKYEAPAQRNGQIIDTLVVKMEPQFIDRDREVKVEKTVWSSMPAVHFKRGSYAIDEETYANDLDRIYNILSTDAKDQQINIYGYADHVGNKEFNDELTQKRAEAVKEYLIKRGISANRFVEVSGKGKDLNKKGEEAYSVDARRVDIVVKDN